MQQAVCDANRNIFGKLFEKQADSYQCLFQKRKKSVVLDAFLEAFYLQDDRYFQGLVEKELLYLLLQKSFLMKDSLCFVLAR